MSLPKYLEYKLSGIAWPRVVPAHWNCPAKLGAISSLKGRLGWQGLKADEYREDGPYVVSSAHFSDHKIRWDDCPRVSEERYETDSNIQLAVGDILLMKDGAAMGKLAFVDTLPGRACLNSHLLLFRPLCINSSLAYFPKFAFYFMQTRFFQEHIRVNGTGATFLGISQEAIAKHQIAWPQIEEQKIIASLLDRETGKIDALIAEQEKLITMLAEKRRAIISHAVTRGLNPNAPMKDSGVPWLGAVPSHWDVKPLRRVISDVKAGPFGSALTKDMYVTSGYRVYGQEQVIPADFSIGDYYISKEKFGELAQYQVSPGDILISCVGTFGKIAIAPGDVEPGIINPRLIRMRVGKSLLGSYLEAVLRSSVIFEQFSFMSRGGTMDVINIGTLSAITLAVPPLVEQVGLLEFLDIETTKLDNLKVEAERAISLLKERRNALIAAAVTGQIDVRGPVVQQAASPELVIA